jgi:hypothetical protein
MKNKGREAHDCILTALEKYVFRPIDEIRFQFYFTVCDNSGEERCNVVCVLIQYTAYVTFNFLPVFIIVR